MRVNTVDYHTAGEPLRIVTGGLPEIPGESMQAKRRYMKEEMDHYRRFLMLEPRGHADMYGAVLTEPVTADGDVGGLFLHNEGYSTMCGHGIIALATAAVEHGLFAYADPQAMRFDTPAGRVTASANRNDAGMVESPQKIRRDRRRFGRREAVPTAASPRIVQRQSRNSL